MEKEPEKEATESWTVFALEYCVQEASKNGIAAVILGVSTAAAAGTTVIMAPILASATMAAAATFIAYYGAGEVYNALEKAGYIKDFEDMLMKANKVGINSWETLPVSDFVPANQASLEAKYNNAASTYLGNALYQPRWAAILPVLKKDPMPAV